VNPLKTVVETATGVKDSVEEFTRSAKESTGSALHSAASSVRSGSATIDNVANGAAAKLDATGSFIENWELRHVFNGMRDFGRNHLAGTVMVAAAAGFFAGSALRRSVHSCARSTNTN
jgi:hypothetical protein